MKASKYLLILLIAVSFILSSCGGKSEQSSAAPAPDSEAPVPETLDSEEPSEPEAPDSEEESAPESEETNPADAAAASEKAMENFLAKLREGNYVLDAKDFLKTTAYSRDLVYFEYAEDIYEDFVVMSVENETFQAMLRESGLEEVVFLGEGQAIDAAEEKLPNYWAGEAASEGNIYNLFYNNPENPLEFVSYEDTVKQSLASFTGYGSAAVRLMHEVYLVLDGEDPSEVHLKAEVDDDPVARISFEDIDVAITFGNAENNAAAQAWMENPVYPEAKTEWNESDIFILNSVFLPGYGEAALPFPTFASHAFKMDEENFVANDEVSIRDCRATEEDMKKYAASLIENGFEEVQETAEDGTVTTWYRRMLREEYKCYSSVNLEYDNGVSLVAKKYYDFPVYEELGAVNEVIGKCGFTELPASENIISVKATDTANESTESWLYFFNYDLMLDTEIDFSDEAEMQSYIKSYEEALVNAGFTQGEDDEEEGIIVYESPNGFSSFRYLFADEDTAAILYKSEKYISEEEAEKMIRDAGFPAIDLNDTISCRDLRAFRKAQYGLDQKAFITVGQTFASGEEAEKFLSEYEAVLNAAGFDRENPAVVGSNKQVALVNADGSMAVGIDFFEEEGGATVNFDFSAE